MSNRDLIVSALKHTNYCDDCLSEKTGIDPRQTVNAICRQLNKNGLVSRHRSECPICNEYKIVNRWLDTRMQPQPQLSLSQSPSAGTIEMTRKKFAGEVSTLSFEIDYFWEPFTVDGEHLTFRQHVTTRLFQPVCSHWGSAIYKWEGILHQGSNNGKTGILIGETKDLRQRIKQYINGTQKSGNLYWRENFLVLGDIYLYTLKLTSSQIKLDIDRVIPLDPLDFSSGNLRLIYEQLLVMQTVEVRNSDVWIVNRKL